MARLSRKEIDEIIKSELPGYRVASLSKKRSAAANVTGRDSVGADAVTPALAKLREKYLGRERAAVSNNPHGGADAVEEFETDGDEDDVIVPVEPDDRDPLDRGARAKSVVVLAKDKKIIGRQGLSIARAPATETLRADRALPSLAVVVGENNSGKIAMHSARCSSRTPCRGDGVGCAFQTFARKAGDHG
jgi:hypothetical protein